MSVILEIEKLNVSYHGTPVLKDLTLNLHKGEVLGIVGESGSGKSTLLKAIIGLLGENGRVDSGRLEFDGMNLLRLSAKKREARRRLHKIRGTRLGMVFQNPGASFNPIRKIGVQFTEALKSHGKVNEQEAKAQILELFAKLSLQDGARILNSYPFELSGGMSQRVAIALAMVMNPELLLADEPTSALDVTVQAQCVKEMMELRSQLGTTIMIVSHNMGVVSYMADKIAVMYAGHLVEYGKKADVLNNPQHPYTKALIGAIPSVDGGSLTSIPNCLPVFGRQNQGCPFTPRCKVAKTECAQLPILTKTYCEPEHWTLCSLTK